MLYVGVRSTLPPSVLPDISPARQDITRIFGLRGGAVDKSLCEIDSVALSDLGEVRWKPFCAKPQLRLLLDHLGSIRDTRQSWKVAYPLRDVLFLVVAARLPAAMTMRRSSIGRSQRCVPPRLCAIHHGDIYNVLRSIRPVLRSWCAPPRSEADRQDVPLRLGRCLARSRSDGGGPACCAGPQGAPGRALRQLRRSRTPAPQEPQGF